MIYIHEFSLMNALGNTNSEILSNLKSGIAPGMKKEKGWLVSGEPAYFGKVDDNGLNHFPEKFLPHQSRNNQLLLTCFNHHETAFRALLSGYSPARVGVILGTSTSGSREAESYVRASLFGRELPFHGYSQELGDPSRFLSLYLGLTGPAFTISTACTSSTRSFISADRLINSGVIDAAIVGGVDTLSKMPINGFDSLEAMSHGLCRPFSKDRDGITIGEGVGLFFVSGKKAPIALLGFGESSDGYHMTSPIPTGEGAIAAMKQALDHAKLQPQEMAYLNLHGTGTVLNDQMECLAVSKVFGTAVACTSTKNLTGHTLGAAGATEAGILSLLLGAETASIPGQGLDEDRYDNKVLDMGLILQTRNLTKGPMMTNNFAFGGNNVSLIFGHPNE